LPGRLLASDAFQTSGPELTSMKSGLDGAAVRFSGEVVSEALAGGDGHVWVNVLSEGVAVGVWLPRAGAVDLEAFGTWHRTGEIVEVVGTFNEACDEHGGDLDVHADGLVVTAGSQTRQHPISYWKIIGGVSGLVVGYAVLRRMWRREEMPL
jgi:hypothetical protein